MRSVLPYKRGQIDLRIISGTKKGRSFDAPPGRNTRPTLARVKEAMFGMIQFEIEGRYALDLFAGSGSLGFEALSRGASEVVLCDSSRDAAKLIMKNISTLGFESNARFFCCDCYALIKMLVSEGRKFSLVLLDPPYAAGLTEGVIEALVSSDLLDEGCIILAEHAWKEKLHVETKGIVCREPRKYGDSAVTYMEYFSE